MSLNKEAIREREPKESEMMRVATEAAKEASVFLKQAFGGEIKDLETKSADDLSSFADKEAERMIIARLSAQFPNHNILGEESGLVDKGSPFTWVIDPLDGSTNFVQGIPYFGCSIGLAEQGRPVLGVITHPLTGQMIKAEVGRGTWMEGKRMQSEDRPIPKSVLAFDLGRKEKDQILEIVRRFAHVARYTRMGGSAVIAMMEVAMGRNQAYIHNALKDWDACAGAIIIQEAGGVVTDLENNPWKLGQSSFVGSSGPNIHAEILEIVHKQ